MRVVIALCYQAGVALKERDVNHATLVVVTLGVLILASGYARAQGVVLPLPPQDQKRSLPS